MEQVALNVEVLLQGILGNNNEIRQQNEAQLETLKQSHPNEVLKNFIFLLRNSTDQSIRTLCAILLRRNLTSLNSNLSLLWSQLTVETKEFLKTNLLEAALNEQQRAVKDKICDCVGELAGNLMTKKGSEQQQVEGWTGLDQLILGFAQKDNPSENYTALKIMATLFTYMNDEFSAMADVIFQIFSKALISAQYEIRQVGLEALSAILSLTDNKILIKSLQNLCAVTLQAAQYILQQDEAEGKEAIQILADIAESESKFFAKDIELTVKFSLEIIKNSQNYTNESISSLALELICTLAERRPKFFRTKDQLLQDVAVCIGSRMLMSATEPDQEWENSSMYKEVDEEADEDPIKEGQKQMDRLLYSIGDEHMLNHFLNIVMQYFVQENDWRYKYVSLVILSEISEYIEDENKLQEMIQICCQNISHQHAKIRWAALNLIGQICEDHSPKVQNQYHTIIAEALFNAIDDTIPVVSAHACASFTNFMEGSSKEVAVEYSQKFLPKLFQKLEQANIVSQQAITAIASLADAAKEHFKIYYNQCLPLLIQMVSKSQDKKMRGKALETITLIGLAVGREIFQEYQVQVIETILIVQNSLQDVDPQRSYVLSSWQRMCIILKENILPYMNLIHPGLLQQVSHNVEIKVQGSETSHAVEEVLGSHQTAETGQQKWSINTYETEEKELGIQTLITFVNELGPHYKDYINQTLEVVYPLVNYTLNDQVRASSAAVLPAIIKCMATKDNVEQVALKAKEFMEYLWKAVLTEYDPNTQAQQIHSVKEIIENMGSISMYLSDQEVQQMGEKVIQLLGQSLAKREIANEVVDKNEEQSDDDEEDQELLDFATEEEDKVHTALADVLGALFKTHPDYCQQVVNYLYTQVLARFLDPNGKPEDHKFAIFIIDDIIEFLGPARVGEYWTPMIEALVRYAVDPNDPVRQAAVYGLGIVAKFSDQSYFSQVSNQLMEVLYKAIMIPLGHNRRTHGHAKDNSIASVGKTIKYQGQTNWIPQWVCWLPLKFDKEEAREQHELLCDLIVSNSTIVFGESNERLPQVILVFAEILKTKLISESTTEKIKLILQQLGAREDLRLIVESAYLNLNEKQQQKLNEVYQTTLHSV